MRGDPAFASYGGLLGAIEALRLRGNGGAKGGEPMPAAEEQDLVRAMQRTAAGWESHKPGVSGPAEDALYDLAVQVLVVSSLTSYGMSTYSEGLPKIGTLLGATECILGSFRLLESDYQEMVHRIVAHPPKD